MSYSAEESSPVNDEYDSCCICDEEFSSDGELASHLLDHAAEEKFKTLLEELESKNKKQLPLTSTPIRTGRPRSEYIKPNFANQTPLKKNVKAPSGEPEIIDILSDDDESNNDQQSNPKRVKLSNNSFKPVNTVTSKSSTSSSLPNNQTRVSNNSSSVQNSSSSLANNSSSLLDNSSSEKAPSFQQNATNQDKPRPYVCEICKKSFAHKGTLRQHLHLHISDNKSHECRICHKKFSIKSVLRKHEESHELKHLQEQRNKS